MRAKLPVQGNFRCDQPNAQPREPSNIKTTLNGSGITKDQWLMLQRDNVVAAGAAGLGQLGITPTSLAAVAEGWLVQYRRHGRFAQTA